MWNCADTTLGTVDGIVVGVVVEKPEESLNDGNRHRGNWGCVVRVDAFVCDVAKSTTRHVNEPELFFHIG